jgi:hypothetical protein
MPRILDELELSSLDLATIKNLNSKELVKDTISKFFWDWYADNYNDTVYTISLFKIIKYPIKVKDLRKLFVKLFGDPP